MLGALLLALLAAAAADPAPAERLTGLAGLENVGRVAPGIYRGAAPEKAGFTTLQQLGIKTVINLRHYHASSEAEACRRAGLGYEHVMLESSDAPSDADVRRFLAIVTDPVRQPVYFHCWRGKDRTGVMCAAYRMAVQDWTLEQALRELDEYGFFSGWHDLRNFVRDFAARRSLFRVPAR